MKRKIFLGFLLSIAFCLEDNAYTSTITFSSNGIEIEGEGAIISGTNVTITKAGSHLVTGSSDEGNIIIDVSSVNLFLQNLELSSSKTSPIIVSSKLSDIKIISIENVILKDLEDSSTTSGECAVIKIKKKSKVSFKNEKDFKLIGNCKNVIKGGSQASIIFESSNGEYNINGYNNGIASDDSLTFNGGIFTITTQNGDAIKSSPDDTDTDSLGKIIINNGTFKIESYSDGFQAKSKIIINNGNFDIKTENGYNSNTFDKDTGSAKGFKVSNNVTGCEIRVYNGEFNLNTADDSFHSNGNLTLINGNYKIYSGDDGLHAEFHLLIGKNDSSKIPNINILNSYEAIEGMSIRIYSGKINVTASDDGMNAAGGSSSSDVQPGPGPGPHSLNEPNPGPTPSGNSGNSSYFISIYGGEINIFCEGDGLDSNGNIFIHGGDVNVFSAKSGDNEPVDHDGNFTLFDGIFLGVGSKGMEYVHEGILKGNQMYAYYSGTLSQDKILKIKNGNGDIVKEGNITKTIDYIFYSSPDTNKNYKLYIYDKNGGNEKEYTLKFGTPTSGSDDQDTKIDDGGKDNQDGQEDQDNQEEEDPDNSSQKEEDESDDNSTKTFLICFFSVLISLLIIIFLFFLLRKRCNKKNNIDAFLENKNSEYTQN